MLTVSQVYKEAVALQHGMSISIAEKIIKTAKSKEEIITAIKKHRVMCDECEQDFNLDSVRCKENGDVICDDCRD